MTQGLKQRLVGAVVLVIAVVWLVPELFENEEDVNQEISNIEEELDEFSSRIVPLEESQPQDETFEETDIAEINADETPVEVPEAAYLEAEVEPVSTVVSEELPLEATLDSGFDEESSLSVQASEASLIPVPLPKPIVGLRQSSGERMGLSVWAIQLGSFGESKNALGLRDRLRAKGYRVFVQPAYSDAGLVTRVFVGPELYRDEANAVRDRLYAETTLDGLVVRYPGGEG